MLLDSRVARIVVETAEQVGISRIDLLEPLGLRESDVLDEGREVEWGTLTAIIERLFDLFGRDAERMRDIGRRFVRAPTYGPARNIARAAISVRRLYEIANRWIAPATFPHLPLDFEFVTPERLRMHAEIPPSSAPSAGFFYIFEGCVAHFPTLLGLPPAVMVESRITPRTCDFVVQVPRVRSLTERARLGVRSLLGAREALDSLEQHRNDLVRGVVALQRARDELRVLLDRLPDLVVVHQRGVILWANRTFVNVTGRELDGLIGTPLLDVVEDRSRRVVLERMRDSPDNADAAALTQVLLRTAAGAEVVVEVAPAQAVVFEGVPARMIVGRDITERVRMQERLVIADRLAASGLLAAGVAHEVNNPLAYVLNNIELAQKQLGELGPSADASRDALAVALEGVHRIRTIVRDLLQLSRGDEGMLHPTDVGVVAEKTLALAAGEIEGRATLVRDFRSAPPVRASDARIAQILLNLVANALEAMQTRPRAECELVVRIGPAPDGRVAIEVSDTGQGIPEADIPRLFEPFFTTKPAGHGTGLGLAIVHRLVLDLDGEITVSSKLGQGSTFRVLLPAARAP